MINTLTLALSVFHQNDIRAIHVSKDRPDYFHLYYRMNGKNRVMLVPKETPSAEQLQSEVNILLRRSAEEQHKIGALDAR